MWGIVRLQEFLIYLISRVNYIYLPLNLVKQKIVFQDLVKTQLSSFISNNFGRIPYRSSYLDYSTSISITDLLCNKIKHNKNLFPGFLDSFPCQQETHSQTVFSSPEKKAEFSSHIYILKLNFIKNHMSLLGPIYTSFASWDPINFLNVEQFVCFLKYSELEQHICLFLRNIRKPLLFLA